MEKSTKKRNVFTFQQGFIGYFSTKVARVEGHVAEVSQGGGQLDEEVTGQTPHHLEDTWTNKLFISTHEQTKFAIIGKFNLTSVLTHYKETNIAGDCSEALSFYLSFHFSLVLFCHILLNLFTKLSLFVIFLIFHDKYL